MTGLEGTLSHVEALALVHCVFTDFPEPRHEERVGNEILCPRRMLPHLGPAAEDVVCPVAEGLNLALAGEVAQPDEAVGVDLAQDGVADDGEDFEAGGMKGNARLTLVFFRLNIRDR